MAKKVEKGWCTIPLADLHPAEWNYKSDDSLIASRLEQYIQKRGQIQNLIVRFVPDLGEYEIVNGNHRLPVLERLKIDPAICYSLGAVSREEAIRLAVETNETYFPIDPIKLGERFNDLLVMGLQTHDLAQQIPFTADQIQRYVALLDVDWEQLTPRPAPPTGPQPTDRPVLEITLSPAQFQQWLEFKLQLSQDEGIEDDATAVARLAQKGLARLSAP